jgi:hypothetical protein
MPEFNIDQYKKTWQESSAATQYSKDEIVQMLNKKSTNYIKYILWISVLEFVFFLSLTVFYIFSNEDVNNYFVLMQKLGIEKNANVMMNFEHLYFLMKVLSLVISAIFVVKFFLNFQKIKVESNLKKFILQIIRFKKTVNLFILTNIIFFLLFTAALTYLVFYTLQTQNVELPKETTIGLFVGLLATTLLCIALIWLYYRLVYGIIMRKLSVHLKQLKEIEKGE